MDRLFESDGLLALTSHWGMIFDSWTIAMDLKFRRWEPLLMQNRAALVDVVKEPHSFIDGSKQIQLTRWQINNITQDINKPKCVFEDFFLQAILPPQMNHEFSNLGD